MYYDPEEEWVERVLSVKEKEENQARVQSQQTSWMKKPDGTWKKVPVNTNQSFPDVTRTTCPTGSKLNISVNSQSLFPETVRPPEPVPAPDMSRSIPVLVSGSSSLNPSFSPIVGNKVSFLTDESVNGRNRFSVTGGGHSFIHWFGNF